MQRRKKLSGAGNIQRNLRTCKYGIKACNSCQNVEVLDSETPKLRNTRYEYPYPIVLLAHGHVIDKSALEYENP